MASFSNFMVTPPTKAVKRNYIEISEYSSPNNLLTKSNVSLSSSKWYSSLCKFHRNRALEIGNLSNDFPRTKEGLELKLSFEIESIEVASKPDTLFIVPSRPEVLDPLVQDWEPPVNGKYRYSSSESYLCLSCLPKDVDNDEAFLKLVSRFGPVDSAFLVYYHLTDESLGFGLVEYCSREVACQARNLLHRNKGLFCDWLDHRLVTYTCLYSRFLIAKTQNSCAERLKEYFSLVEKPIYCQVIAKTDFFLVEYLNAEKAILTRQSLLAEEKKNHFHIHLANPGKSALKIYQKILADNQVPRKPEAKLPLLSLLPFRQHPFSLLGSHFSGNIPTSMAAPRIIDTLTPCASNAFGFGLPCSPIVQTSKKKLDSHQNPSLPGPTTAFGFSLPCSPLLKILGTADKEAMVPPQAAAMDEKKEDNLQAPRLLTPPRWKNFKLNPVTLSPNLPMQNDPNVQLSPDSESMSPVVRILKSTVLNTPSSESASAGTSVSTPVSASQSQSKILSKRIWDFSGETVESKKGKFVSGRCLKKRLAMGQLDNNTESVTWKLDTTWSKFEGPACSGNSNQENQDPTPKSESCS